MSELEEPPNCPICDREMQWSSNAQAYLCGPSGSGCEGTLSLKKAQELESKKDTKSNKKEAN